MKNLFLLLTIFITFQETKAQNISPEQRMDNLVAFSKVYGYVRYFHPSDEAADLNWEKFVYYGIKQVENSESTTILNKKLKELFQPIAPTVVIGPAKHKAAFSIKSITPSDKTVNKEISWQHYGLGVTSGLYRSARTNRPSVVPNQEQSNGFGSIGASFDPKPYRGKKIRLKSFLRTELNKGAGQMWIRIERENKKRGLFDNMADRPIRKEGWAAYEIVATIDSDAVSANYGAYLTGLGKLWVDNFSIEIEDQGKWTKIPLKDPSFEESADILSKHWKPDGPGYRCEIITDNPQDGKKALLISENTKYKTEEKIFDAKPKFGDYFYKEIGLGLSCSVPLVLMGTDQFSYPIVEKIKTEKFQEEISKVYPEKPSASDVYTRLTGVVIAWNIFQHFYPYKDEIDMQWQQQLPISLNEAYEANTSSAYITSLRVLTEKLKDGHVRVGGPGDANYYSIPAGVTLSEGQIVVNELDSIKNPDEQTFLRPGDIITHIDEKPALERLEAQKKLISGSVQWKNNRALSEFFSGPEGSSFRLNIKRGTEEKVLSFVRKNFRRPTPKTNIRKLEHEIYYINIGNTEMKDINTIMPELMKAKGLICDLRGYPKGNHELISHLLTVDDTNKWMFVPQIIHPDYEKVSYQGLGWQMKPSKTHISAKVVFLTAGGAISYAESYMGFIKQYKLATIVGQPTAGANGNVNSFILPGDYRISFTGMKVKQQDGSQLQSIGIQPDVFVVQTLKGITEGRDEYLEKAIELLKP